MKNNPPTTHPKYILGSFVTLSKSVSIVYRLNSGKDSLSYKFGKVLFFSFACNLSNCLRETNLDYAFVCTMREIRKN